MIDRIIILLLLVLFLPQLYFDRRKWRRRGVLVRVLSWLPTLAMMVATVVLALERDFTTPDQAAENTYLLVFGLYFIPKAVYVLCSIVGRIGDDQLADYARRRGLPADDLRRFLRIADAG